MRMEETLYLLEKKTSMLGAGGSTTLFLCENWVIMWNEYLWSKSSLKWENHSHYEKHPLQMKWKNTCILWNNTICVRGRSVMHIVSLWELSYPLQGILPTSQGFQVGEIFTLCKIALSMRMEETLYLLGKKNLC
jgi:hypothetical protein